MHASVNLGVDVLHEIGFRKYTTHRKAAEFIRYDEHALEKLAKERHQKDTYILSVKEEIEYQEKILAEDKMFIDVKSDNAWDSYKRLQT
jgi:CPA2 family monovalent cation:H+ antiporter-2